jgi:hypothetical protein
MPAAAQLAAMFGFLTIHDQFPKSEIRISKSETNPKGQNSNDQNSILKFEFRICFEFRISNFVFSLNRRW